MIKRVCDDNITDTKVIKSILEAIKDKQLFCSFAVEIDHRLSLQSKARILETDEEFFTYRSFSNKATVKDKARYSDLIELKVETEVEKTIDISDQDNRWFVLDLDEE